MSVFPYFYHMGNADFFRGVFEDYLENYQIPDSPENLYKPIRYIMGLGGKRIRPVLTLMGCDIHGGDFNKALPAALAVEVFHNFSLVHDDIMDDAPLRRGQSTVHNRWDTNTAILSGDAMLITSYQLLEAYDKNELRDLISIFSATAMNVCEGQQLDMDFENRKDVKLDDYLLMITKKTAVLLGASMQMGAVIAGVSKDICDKSYQIGVNLGLAFQIQDDYLDAFGDPESFGKQVGGDIIENKKTFLYLKALEQAKGEDLAQLKKLYSDPYIDPLHKVNAVKEIYLSCGVEEITRGEIERFTQQAFTELDSLSVQDEKIKGIKELANSLMVRTA